MRDLSKQKRFSLKSIFQRFREAPAAARDMKKAMVKRVGLVFTSGQGGRQNFETAPYPFEDIIAAYNTDCYVRQALDKYIELMFKSGWTIKGKREEAVMYVRQRLQLIAEQTGVPTEQLWIEISEDLVKFGNAFIVKARQKPGQGLAVSGLTFNGIGGQQPVGGYFVLPVQTIGIARDKNGTVLGYQQNIQGQDQPLRIKPEDMIHYYYKRDHGRAFGNPFVGPVLDDVRLLREVEENVARLIYRHLNPLYVYTVGIPEPGFEATDDEINAVRSEIENMPTDGGLVLPERHKVEAVGAEGNALDAEGYLRYYEQRVFTGLGLPETLMGRGDTANRGTSDNLSAEARDRIKAFQRVMEIFTNSFIINELLLEGGFDPLTNPEDAVSFEFNEIDSDNKVKLENHAIQLWINNLITQDEARIRIGEDPVDGDQEGFYHSIITGNQIQPDDATQDNKSRPQNQHGKKTGPKKSDGGKNPTVKQSKEDEMIEINEEKLTKEPEQQEFSTSVSNIIQEKNSSALESDKTLVDQYLENLKYYHSLAKQDLIDAVKLFVSDNTSNRHIRDFSPKDMEFISELTQKSIKEKVLPSLISKSLEKGIKQCKGDSGATEVPEISIASISYALKEEFAEDIRRFYNDVLELISKSVKADSMETILAGISGGFKAIEYRLKFMASTHTIKAYNIGYASTAKALGYKEIQPEAESSCDVCAKRSMKPISLKGDFYSLLPPWHNNCKCKVKVQRRDVDGE